MPKAIDQDLRDRVIDAVIEEGMSRRRAAVRFGVSVSSAVKWVQAINLEKRRRPVGTGGHRRSPLPPVRTWLLEQIAARPEQILAGLCQRLRDEQGTKASPSMLSRFFRKEGISFKKNDFRHRAGQARYRLSTPAVAEVSEPYCA